ncbi:MAG TPA: hypothetical protein VGL18_15490 [Actinomycetota bacterium]
MRRALFVLAVTALLLPGCGGADRPEGVVERWLVSLNQGKAGQPEKYAPDALSQKILPNWQRRDPGDLDVIEVGKGRAASKGLAFRGPRPSFLVPFRVKRLNGRTESGLAGLQRASGGWQILDLLPTSPSIRVPSEGGDRLGRATPAVWLAGVGIAILLTLAAVALMTTIGREARVSG